MVMDPGPANLEGHNMSEQPRDDDGRWTSGGSGSKDISDALYRQKEAAAMSRGHHSERQLGRQRLKEATDQVNRLYAERDAAQRASDTNRAERMIAMAAQMYGEGSPQHEWAKQNNW